MRRSRSSTRRARRRPRAGHDDAARRAVGAGARRLDGDHAEPVRPRRGRQARAEPPLAAGLAGPSGGRLAVVGADGAIAFTESGFAPLTVARLLRRYGGRSLRNVKGVASSSSPTSAGSTTRRTRGAPSARRAICSRRRRWRSGRRARAAALGEVAAEGTAELVEALMGTTTARRPKRRARSAAHRRRAARGRRLEGGVQNRRRQRPAGGEAPGAGERLHALRPPRHRRRALVRARGRRRACAFRLRFVGADKVEGSRRFDYVVLAAPPTPKLELSELRGAAWLRRGGLEYTRVHTTLVWGLLDPAAFGARAAAGWSAQRVRRRARRGRRRRPQHFIVWTDRCHRREGRRRAAAAPAAAVAGCADYPGVAVPRWKLFSPAALDDAALGRALVWHDRVRSCATRGRRPARTRSRGRATPTATARSRRGATPSSSTNCRAAWSSSRPPSRRRRRRWRSPPSARRTRRCWSPPTLPSRRRRRRRSRRRSSDGSNLLAGKEYYRSRIT